MSGIGLQVAAESAAVGHAAGANEATAGIAGATAAITAGARRFTGVLGGVLFRLLEARLFLVTFALLALGGQVVRRGIRQPE